MSTLDLATYNEQVVQPVKTDDNIPTKTEAPVTEQPTDAVTGTIKMVGPLSGVFAKALIQVLGENASKLSTEASAQQVATIIAYNQNEEKTDSEDHIVYVDDERSVRKDPSQAFDRLRIALDMQCKGKKLVVLESGGMYLGSSSTWLNYAYEHADKVIHGHQKAAKYIKSMVG